MPQNISSELKINSTQISVNTDKSQQEGSEREAFKQFEAKTLKSVHALLSEYDVLIARRHFFSKNKSIINFPVKVPNSNLLTQIVFELPNDSLTRTNFLSPQFVSQIEMTQNKLAETLTEINLDDGIIKDGIRDIKFTLNIDGTVDFLYGNNEVQKLRASDIITSEENSEID